jgi:uncharacterized protein with HEPN domain
MSRREWQALIRDILEAIGKITQYTQDMPFEAFEDDERTIDAVIRNLIVIGEAAVHVPQEVAFQHPEIPWRLMGDMRNFAVHQYWGVEPAVLWRTVKEDLPSLVKNLEGVLLAEPSSD